MRKLLLGSSPLTRGKRAARSSLSASLRLIPAHAGKTTSSLTYASVMSAHPRSRGENPTGAPISIEASGSSPLTRGKRRIRRRTGVPSGLIPAHAGKTRSTGTWAGMSQAHPRSRGENEDFYSESERRRGSSPLTRGKLFVTMTLRVASGLIPAHAGKTRWRAPSTRSRPAHPRSRGENEAGLGANPHHDGSSPLTRGKRRSPRRWDGARRLIPAHAGKTLPDLRFYCADRSDLGNP